MHYKNPQSMPLLHADDNSLNEKEKLSKSLQKIMMERKMTQLKISRYFQSADFLNVCAMSSCSLLHLFLLRIDITCFLRRMTGVHQGLLSRVIRHPNAVSSTAECAIALKNWVESVESTPKPEANL